MMRWADGDSTLALRDTHAVDAGCWRRAAPGRDPSDGGAVPNVEGMQWVADGEVAPDEDADRCTGRFSKKMLALDVPGRFTDGGVGGRSNTSQCRFALSLSND